MKNILTEIKNFKRLIKLYESGDKEVKVVLIGDKLAEILNTGDFTKLPNLVDDPMTIDKLLMRLSKQDKMTEIDHVFVSIGLDDKFQNKKIIPFLVEALDNIFPYAEIYVIKGIVSGDFFYGGETTEDFKSLEDDILDFYKVFKQNGLKVIGNYQSVNHDFENVEVSISMLKNQIADSLFQNITNNGDRLNPLSVDEPFIYRDNQIISGDDETDFDTIYEFLERFEKIVKSGNRYDTRTSNSFKTDIEQIQIALRFILQSSDIEITGKYDVDTEEAIFNFQEEQEIEPTGIADKETLEDLLFELKTKSFDDEDLGKFLAELGISEKDKIFLDGSVEIDGLSGEKETNVNFMIDYMNQMGITNPYTQIGILSVIGKESGFIPKDEICYDGTSDSRIKSIFGSCRTGDDKIKEDWSWKYGDYVDISIVKQDCEDFFDAVYGPQASECFSFNTGNDTTGDGYKYRGRGFNGITFKTIYARIGGFIGEDLVSNPERLNDVEVAAKAAVAFFTDGKSGSSLPEFTNVKDAINYFVDKNAGGSANAETRGNAFEVSKNFNVIP